MIMIQSSLCLTHTKTSTTTSERNDSFIGFFSTHSNEREEKGIEPYWAPRSRHKIENERKKEFFLAFGKWESPRELRLGGIRRWNIDR